MGLPPKGDTYNRVGAYFGNLKVYPTAQPSMKVKITEGYIWVDGTKFVEYAGGNSPTVPTCQTAAKFSVIAIDKLGTILVFNGSESLNPQVPSIPEGHIPLALCYTDLGNTAIYDDMIFDVRPFVGASIFSPSHNNTKSRDASDCHSISSISNLQNELDSRPTLTGTTQLLDFKADIDGTISPNFTINKDLSGVSAEDCSIIINRGTEPDVKLFWNESKTQWEVTKTIFINSEEPSTELNGIILVSPNGSKYKITIQDDGILKTTIVT